MELHSWITFVVGTMVICATPGPNMLQVMNSSVRYGMKPAMFTMFGCFSGVYILFVVSMFGVGAFLSKYPVAFDILRFMGALYLIYLGLMAWKQSDTVPVSSDSLVLRSYRNLFYDGFFVGISNPKALLFSVAFFPQFINFDAPQGLQFIILLVSFAVIEICCYLLYALAGRKMAYFMKNSMFQKIFNRVTGAIFVMFGVFLVIRSR